MDWTETTIALIALAVGQIVALVRSEIAARRASKIAVSTHSLVNSRLEEQLRYNVMLAEQIDRMAGVGDDTEKWSAAAELAREMLRLHQSADKQNKE